ncbi:glycosyltransferase family 4 protein [Paraburkholderia sp. CNPSo 3272]|uniref:glycosyltransferase family 4 protein n=1 Tax=Paraburkholderia sp. CNPSo 3272 TaxID=2940931 RepID=UPI0020B83196|nr:glycosyltransferase family 4 protein [Paraburkholderia sp. CNPSo 3272]MCP3727718.1 glycosyltransferase family 4 protein [Paraburkholderia sp. CNPSo 3272]
MRIAQIAPLYECVPPQRYGATERIVHYLTEALVERGHDVTLFASGDSQTRATLIPCCARALWHDRDVTDTLVHHVAQLERVAARAHEFDVMHFHTEPLHLPLACRLNVASLTTLHGVIRPQDLGVLLDVSRDAALVALSQAQRECAPHANWLTTVGHGLPFDLFRPSAVHDGYLLWMGRMMPGKGPDAAIEIARRSGKPLKMAAVVHPGERAWFEDRIRPLLRRHASCVEYLGEVGGELRAMLLSRAEALLMPITWNEPFGLVMIEALASGTPVIANRRGAVPEVLRNGVSGFIVDGLDAAVDAVARLPMLSRDSCRAEFERRFTAARMCDDYLAAYDTLIARRGASHTAPAWVESRLSQASEASQARLAS